MTHFKLLKEIDELDKFVEIVGPDDLNIRVDFDDVNTAEVERAIIKMIMILNAGWERVE